MGIRRQPSRTRDEAVVVAIDKDKGSQYAFKWAVEHVVKQGQTLTLLHVKQTAAHAVPDHTRGMVPISEVSEEGRAKVYRNQLDAQAKEWLLPMRCFCMRKHIKCKEVIVEDTDVPKALINYVIANSIEILVLGAPSKFGIFRFKTRDVPSTVLKGAPKFCTVYVIGRQKISSMRSGTGALPPQPNAPGEFKSPSFTRETTYMKNNSHELSSSRIMSLGISRRGSLGRTFAFSDKMTTGMTSPRHSTSSELDSSCTTTSYSRTDFIDTNSLCSEFSSSSSIESGRSSTSQLDTNAMEAELTRLRLELKKTMDMYTAACREAVVEKQKEKELSRWKMEGEYKLEEAQLAGAKAFALADKEKAKCKAAIEEAKLAQRIAKLELKKSRNKLKALKQAKEGKKVLETLTYDLAYRRYTIQELEAATNHFSQARKIGEGGYGPVYIGELDHTQVAIKILRPDAAQGRLQFQKEVEVLSCIRHPNMVLLLGACPEYGCLVYEYMANGSLEDCLFRQGNKPAIPWQLRFRIAAEICTGILFLHQTKPEPIVHRDLKPGNILLDHNYVTKISDVGLARLVPPSVADTVTQYCMTSTAGTFCYIDPEYQQTGMLGTKSDTYSLGVMLLQLITAKPPMGLTHHVEKAIEDGTFTHMLDPAVPDWPVEEALNFAKLALKCAEMRRKDRPDLGKVVLPELNRLSALAQHSWKSVTHNTTSGVFLPRHRRLINTVQDVVSDNYLSQSSRSSRSSYTEGRHSEY